MKHFIKVKNTFHQTTHSQEYRQVFTVDFLVISQQEKLRGGRCWCPSPGEGGMDVPLPPGMLPCHLSPFLSLPFTPGFILLFSMSLPTLMLPFFLFHSGMFPLNKQKSMSECYRSKIFTKAKLREGETDGNLVLWPLVFLKLKSSSERGLESLKSVRSCMNICIKVKKGLLLTGRQQERL